MKKIILLIACVLVWSPWASAQVSSTPGLVYSLGTPFEGDVAFGYQWVLHDGNRAAGKYEYLHSSLAGHAEIEYDPLPNRFLMELFVNNVKDYYGEVDYAYSDIVMFNFTGRRFFRNMRHWSIGTDDPATPSPSMTDFDPAGGYFLDSGMNRAQVRFKTPDFPFHLYLEAKNQEKHGTIQQRFMRSFSNGFSKASDGRVIDYETNETKVTVNSHLNFVEVEYSHATKEFANTQDKAMADNTAVAYTHNQISDTESSTDTIRVHSSHTGRIAASATYSAGERENKNSNVKADLVNAGADFTWIPSKDVTVSLRYRHAEVSQDGPVTVTSVSLGGATTYSVRDAISTTRDALAGYVRYRATDRLTVRGEIIQDALTREFDQNAWELDKDITRLTARFGATYRVLNRLILRGDVSHQSADVPANSVDNTYNDTTRAARASLTWVPSTWFNLLLSGGTVLEKRDQLAPPFTGPRETERNRAQGSMTFVVGKRTAIIPTYAVFQNTTNAAVAYTGLANSITVEDGVPYADTAHLASLAVTHAVSETVTVTADATRTWSRGSWQNAGVVSGSDGISAFSSLKVIESELGGDLRIRFDKHIGTEFRYRYVDVDDRLDNTENGTVQLMLATLTVVW